MFVFKQEGSGTKNYGTLKLFGRLWFVCAVDERSFLWLQLQRGDPSITEAIFRAFSTGMHRSWKSGYIKGGAFFSPRVCGLEYLNARMKVALK